MQYVPTDLPQYWKLHNRSQFSNAVIGSDAVLLFSQDGQTLMSKTHQGIFITVGGSNSASFDFSATTLQASDALQGKSFYNSLGELVQGTVPTVSATLSANKVSIPKGYIAVSDSITVAQAGSATVSGNIVTVPVGYIASQREVIVGTAKGSDSYVPSTEDQPIAAGYYLTGTQKIKGDPNLTAQNIASGVSIFGVQGSHQGGTGSQDLDAYVVQSNSGVLYARKLKFNGTQASDSQTVELLSDSSVLIFNTGHPEPQGGSTPGSSMDFYKCASVSGADYYTVSGAGDSSDSPVNGSYTDSGQSVNGKPVYSYTSGGTTYYLFFWGDEWNGEYWCIGTSTNIEYYPPEEVLYFKSGGDTPAGGEWYTGQGSGNAPTVTLTHPSASVPKTWTGYKAVYDSNNGRYDCETTVTTGLTWSSVPPHINGIYTSDTMATITSLYGWELPTWPAFDSDLIWSVNGSPTLDISGGIKCVKIDSSQYVYCNDPVITPSGDESNPSVFTLSAWLKRNGQNSAVITLSGGYWGPTGREIWLISDAGHVSVSNGAENNADIYSGTATSDWVNIIAAWTGTAVKVWINGQPVQIQQDTTGYTFSSYDLYLYVGSLRRATSAVRGNGYYAGVKVYNRVITDVEAAALYAEFTPTT